METELHQTTANIQSTSNWSLYTARRV